MMPRSIFILELRELPGWPNDVGRRLAMAKKALKRQHGFEVRDFTGAVLKDGRIALPKYAASAMSRPVVRTMIDIAAEENIEAY
jgi:hypothetical protein